MKLRVHKIIRKQIHFFSVVVLGNTTESWGKNTKQFSELPGLFTSGLAASLAFDIYFVYYYDLL